MANPEPIPVRTVLSWAMILVLVGVGGLYRAFTSSGRNFVAVTAKVVSLGEPEPYLVRGRTGYRADLRYSYTFEGRVYEGVNTVRGSTKEEIASFKDHPDVTTYVDPSDPSKPQNEAPFQSSGILQGIFGSFALLVGLGLGISVLRKKA